MKPPRTIPEKARRDADVTLEQASRAAGICPAYLRRIELHGCDNFGLARRLWLLRIKGKRVYDCPGREFQRPTYLSSSSFQGQATMPSVPAGEDTGVNPRASRHHSTRYHKPGVPILTLIED